jgi:phage shock protein A
VEAALRRADRTEALLEQLGERLNRALARQAKLRGQWRQAEEMARQWDRRVDEVLRAGDEAAAREAVRNKLAYTQVATELGASLARETAVITELQGDLAKLESRLARVREKSRAPLPPVQEPQPATGDTTVSAAIPAADQGSAGEEVARGLDALRERMSRVWSDDEIEQELDAIKNRLSAGGSAETG